MTGNIGRRQLLAALGGCAAWPIAAQAQQPERMRLVGFLTGIAADDPESAARIAAFAQGLQEAGWSVGRNLRIEYRWGAGDAGRLRRDAAELIALAPDVILAASSPAMAALQQAPATIPIVFVAVTDPVGAGLVASLGRPGGNVTGFTVFEYGLSAKWLELLKQIAPNVKRVAILRDPAVGSGVGQFAAIQTVAPSLGTELIPVGVENADAIERTISDFARRSNGGLVVTASPLTAVHRGLIIALAAKNRLPAVYPFRYFVTRGGLISYGPDLLEQHRLAAGYIDRILRGEKPADLPVQNPTKYRLVINLRAAKTLGLDIPVSVYARADEVIE